MTIQVLIPILFRPFASSFPLVESKHSFSQSQALKVKEMGLDQEERFLVHTEI
jgi:hypothetical protein